MTMALGAHPHLSIALSGQSLFMSDWDGQGGLQGWKAHQNELVNVPMLPGPAFEFARKLLNLNRAITHQGDETPIQIQIISRQRFCGASRFIQSLEHHGLTAYHGHGLLQTSYLGGASPYRTLKAISPHLYLSTNPDSVREVLEKSQGRIGAACLSPFTPHNGNGDTHVKHDKLVVGFDGDAVIFDDDADKDFLTGGLEFAKAGEAARGNTLLRDGPLAGFLRAIQEIRCQFDPDPQNSPLHLILVTARGVSSQKRVLHTLNDWGIEFDEAHFLSGRAKGAMLEQAGTTIFFDDLRKNTAAAEAMGIPAGHVPWGVMNEKASVKT